MGMVSLVRVRRPAPEVSPAARRGGRALAVALTWSLVLSWVATVVVLILSCGAAITGRPAWWAYLLALVLIVVTVEPVRRWVRRGVEDVVFTHHDDAFAVVTRLGRQLQTPLLEPDRTSIAAILARTVGVSYVEVIDGDETASVIGTPPTDREVHVIPLAYADQPLGRVLVAARRPGVPLSADELSLLGDLAQQLAIGMYGVRASEEVTASRTALVTAREEERRRIRRDLHDGLGPTLASVRLQLAAAQRLLATQPAEVAEILADVGDQMNQTTAEIRRLVYGLRPPLLDELGLVAAIRNHPASLGTVQVSVSPDVLPSLPAAVEVALYRIVTEAIHNVVRHSGGLRASVLFDVSAVSVSVVVSDDGRGLPDPFVAGVGVSAIRERAAEIGGTAEWLTNVDGGASVVTTIPLEGVLK
jgi:two-component system, NarL family, sensor kinase